MSDISFSYDHDWGLHVVVVPEGIDRTDVEFTAFGSEYEDANTMFAVKIEGERVYTTRPESILVWFFSEIVGERMYLLESGESVNLVSLPLEEQIEMAKMTREIKRGMKDSPLAR
jgi:hypothetical protein